MTEIIKIEVDVERKHIQKLEFPEGLNPIEIIMVLMEVQKMVLQKLKIEKKENKIIKPKIVGV